MTLLASMLIVALVALLYHKEKIMAQRSTDKRLPIYVTHEELQIIRIAAAYSGKSMAAFAKEHILEIAKQVIAEHTQQVDRSDK